MSTIWQSIAYLDPERGEKHCGWCMRWGHGIENCPQLEVCAKSAAEKAVEELRIVEVMPSFSVEAEREHRNFTIAWKTFWLCCGAAILAVIWRLTR